MKAACPAYLSRASLAHMLDCAEKTVDEMVRRGIIPPPRQWLDRTMRWCWEDVQLALKDYGVNGGGDPYLAGVRNAAEKQKGSRIAP